MEKPYFINFDLNKKTNHFSSQLKEIYKEHKEELDEIFKELKIENHEKKFRFYVLYLQNKLFYCKKCGKPTERIYCSRSCANSNHNEESIKLQQKRTKETRDLKYGKDKTFSSTKEFKLKVRNYWNEKCVNGIDIQKFEHSNDLNLDFILSNFIDENNRFLLEKMCGYFKCSTSFVNKFKKKFGILQENKREFSKSKIQEELFEWIPIENKISNTRKIISPLELDIYLPDYKLAIEYNGSYWHSEIYKDSNYHLNKTKLCKEKGIDLIHVFEFDDLEIVKSIILDRLNKNTVIDSKECELKSVSKVETIKFLKENDLKGKCKFSRSIGLFYMNQLVQLVCIKKNEIKRITTLKNVKIIGGLTKIIKHLDTKNLIYQSDPRYEKEIKEFKQIKILDKHFIKVYNFTIQDCGKRIYKV